MKAKVKMTVEVDVRKIVISIAPRHIGDSEDDDVASDFPGLKNGNWMASVEVDTGKIEGWPEGEDRNLWAKVCDAGLYTLFDAEGKQISQIDGYVPHGLVPGEYGDYIDLKIDGEGFITNWPKYKSLDDFFENDD